MKYLSLCLPTNGIIEWVFPVLDNIYMQEANIDEWELIVTDNGDNEEFYKRMTLYSQQHENLTYRRTNAYLFENQIEALRIAKGEYLKFMNHRSIMEPGTIQWMIDVIKKNIVDKPVMYFSTGALNYDKPQVYERFEDFVRGLKEYASWTTGVGVWRSDFETIPENWTYNKISPHSDVLFWVRDRSRYVIDDRYWCHDIDNGHEKKGKYDLYRAFAVEEISVTLGLLNDKSISADTFKYVVKCYERCVASYYFTFNIMHKPCSYMLDGFNDSMGVFLNRRRVLMRAYFLIFKAAFAKVFRKRKD